MPNPDERAPMTAQMQDLINRLDLPVLPRPFVPMPTRSVSDYTAEELVSRAVRNARPRECGESPRWAAVSSTFALGSTFAAQLCRIHGLDPDEMVSGPRCISCNP